MLLIKKKYNDLFGEKLEKENLVKKELKENEIQELEELGKDELINSWINQVNKKMNEDNNRIRKDQFNKVLFNDGYNYFFDFAAEIMENEKTKKWYYINSFKLDDIITDFIIYDYINRKWELNLKNKRESVKNGKIIN